MGIGTGMGMGWDATGSNLMGMGEMGRSSMFCPKSLASNSR